MSPELDPDALLAAARADTGLIDLGDDRILEGLDVLVRSLDTEARLTDAARPRVAATIVQTLSNRLKVEDYLAQNPELLERPIEKPLFLFGLPRTGTTLAINLLAADPTQRCFLRWEAIGPVPPPKADELRSGPRYHAEQAWLAMGLKICAAHLGDASRGCRQPDRMPVRDDAQSLQRGVRSAVPYPRLQRLIPA